MLFGRDKLLAVLLGLWLVESPAPPDGGGQGKPAKAPKDRVQKERGDSSATGTAPADRRIRDEDTRSRLIVDQGMRGGEIIDIDTSGHSITDGGPSRGKPGARGKEEAEGPGERHDEARKPIEAVATTGEGGLTAGTDRSGAETADGVIGDGPGVDGAETLGEDAIFGGATTETGAGGGEQSGFGTPDSGPPTTRKKDLGRKS